MAQKISVFYIGEKFVVEHAVRASGKSESKSFIESLEEAKRAKIEALIERYADRGKIWNKEQFKKLDGEIWEFKAFQIRVLMFNCERGRIALTHGFIKKKGRTPPSQIKKANDIMQEYMDVRKGMKK